MAVNLNMLLPEWFQNIREFQELLKSEETALEETERDAVRIRDNCYIQRADDGTITNWEQRFGISRGTEDLEERRKAILLWLNLKVPYTEQWLRNLLEEQCGKRGFELLVRSSKSEVDLKIINQELSMLHHIKRLMCRAIPAHIAFTFWGRYQMGCRETIKYENAIHFRTGFYPRYNLAFLNLDNTWKLDGSRLLNGYDGDSRLDFYPVSLRIQIPVKEQVEVGQRLKLFSGAREKIGLNTGYKIQTEARASPKTAEQFTIKTAVKEQSGAGPVRVTNLNVLDNEWTLNDSRKLNGGLTIL